MLFIIGTAWLFSWLAVTGWAMDKYPVLPLLPYRLLLPAAFAWIFLGIVGTIAWVLAGFVRLT